MSGVDRLDEYMLTQVEPIIHDCGHLVQAVFPVGDEGAWFAYTAGLADRAWPELAVTGMTGEQARHLLNDVVAHFDAKGGPPVEGVLPGVIQEPFALRLRLCSSDTEDFPFSVAHRHARACPVPAVQVVWPDDACRFPGDDGYDERFEQPLISTEGRQR